MVFPNHAWEPAKLWMLRPQRGPVLKLRAGSARSGSRHENVRGFLPDGLVTSQPVWNHTDGGQGKESVCNAQSGWQEESHTRGIDSIRTVFPPCYKREGS